MSNSNMPAISRGDALIQDEMRQEREQREGENEEAKIRAKESTIIKEKETNLKLFHQDKNNEFFVNLKYATK